MTSPDPSPPLTPRQLEVLELMAKGLTNPEIGSVLGIALGTVKIHVSAIIEALDVTNRTEAAIALQDLERSRDGAEATSDGERFTVPGFGGRPAIAVLPFQSLGGEPEQEFLVDGLVEDLITRLACFRWFPVIARNSTWVYKGRAVDVREASRDLGARYIVEGSARRSGDRARFVVQLIDGATGEHLWANRYDRDTRDLFRLQDEVVDEIVASLVDPVLLRVERIRSVRQAPQDAGAWECVQRAMFHVYRETREGFEEAQQHFERAQALDAHFAPALHGLAMSRCFQLVNGFTDDPVATLAAALAESQRSVELDPGDPVAHGALGLARALALQPETSAAAFERAIEINPSYAVAHWGLAFARLRIGDAAEALALLEKAIRLSPHDPVLHHMLVFLGLAHLVTGDPAGALGHADASRQLRPDLPWAEALRAACLTHLGRLPEAREAWERVHELEPGFDRGRLELLLPPVVVSSLEQGWEPLAADS